jgi:hypothetical protein
LQGAAGFDTTNQQNLAQTLRPLDNEAFLRQLLTGIRQGETQLNFNQVMAALNQDMERANRVGGTEMMVGGILQNIGAGISGSGSFTAPESRAPAESRPSEGGGWLSSDGTDLGGGNGTGDDIDRQPSVGISSAGSNF